MVGTIVFKNFETGSYEEMRIVAYNGTTYADIGEGEFFSCRVNLEQKGIVYDYTSSEDAPCRSMTAVLLLAKKAREFLYQNPYVTVAEYCFNSADCTLRAVSSKAGVYEPVDFKTLFNNGGFYKCIAEFSNKSPLWRSVLCEGLNFCIEHTFKTSERIFDFSSYGIYVNVSAFPRSVYNVFELPDKLKKTAKSKSALGISLRYKRTKELEYNQNMVYQPFGRLLRQYCVYRIKCFNRLNEILMKTTSRSARSRAILSLPKDKYILSITNDFSEELLDFAMSYADYGYLKSKSHADMLVLREVLLLSVRADVRQKISYVAQARSVNSKLLNKLPCAPYFDSNGTAIWQ